MPNSWYEATTDRKDHVLFVKRDIVEDRKPRWLSNHVHGAIEFAIGLGGITKIIIRDKIYDLTEGRIIFFDRFVPHNYRYLKGSQCYVVVISPSFLDARSGLKGISFPTVMEKNDSFEILKQFLDSAYSFRDINDLTYKCGFVNMFSSAMTVLYPHTVNETNVKAEETAIEIVQYINDHFREDISIDHIAHKFGYSPNYLSSIFNNYVGMSFRDHLNRCRISEYMVLRGSSPELTVAQAAEQVGFQNMKTFYNAMKKAEAETSFRDCEF